jgi:pyruvate/2-oxoglutarate dehydrogenase complex dihydrolipoamide acyltransferase (E2) component
MRSLKILTASFAVLALASCGGGGTTGEAPKGEAVAAVAPPAGKQWIDVVSKTAEGGYLIGNPDAPVKLMEFASLTCHVCAQFSKDSGSDFHDNFINNGKVSYEFRNFVRDELDLMAARIAQCGANEAMLPLTEQFMAFQETLFQNAEKMSANKALEAQGVKLSVNDLLIKALAKALEIVPKCNVSFAGDELRKFSRSDISVAVAAPSGLITPIIVDAANKTVSVISKEMKALADKAREGKLMPHEYQGGTASLSNLGMFGIKQFDAVINPPQAMILAVGAGEQRPYVVDGALAVATVMSVTGSFDHRAIDGADGAQLMQAFKTLVEQPLGLVA